jgi:hypothetical protein
MGITELAELHEFLSLADAVRKGEECASDAICWGHGPRRGRRQSSHQNLWSRRNQPESSMILYITNGDDIVDSPRTPDDIEVELNNRDILKHMWNNGTMSERQALLDALPKIQVISIAGTIN